MRDLDFWEADTAWAMSDLAAHNKPQTPALWKVREVWSDMEKACIFRMSGFFSSAFWREIGLNIMYWYICVGISDQLLKLPLYRAHRGKLWLPAWVMSLYFVSYGTVVSLYYTEKNLWLEPVSSHSFKNTTPGVAKFLDKAKEVVFARQNQFLNACTAWVVLLFNNGKQTY